MSRPAIEAFALRAVGQAISVYADTIDLYSADVHGPNTRTYEHLKALAEHLDDTAHDVARVAKISRILEVGK